MQSRPAIRLQVNTFMAKADEVERVCGLLADLPSCTISAPFNDAAPSLENDELAHYLSPTAVLFLVDADGLGACCTAMCDLHTIWPGVPLLVLADHVNAHGLRRLMACGAFDFGILPGSDTELMMRVGRALGTISLPPREAESAKASALPIDHYLRTRLVGSHPDFLRQRCAT